MIEIGSRAEQESMVMRVEVDVLNPDCPKCNAVIDKEVVKLAEGGFIYLEKCSKNTTHYSHYRRPSWREVEEFNG